MPWTRQQVKLLLSKASPLTGAQQAKMKSELHADAAGGACGRPALRSVASGRANPKMGHAKKGSAALKKRK